MTGPIARWVSILKITRGACNYEEVGNKAGVGAFKIFAKGNYLRERTGKVPRTFKQFKSK